MGLVGQRKSYQELITAQNQTVGVNLFLQYVEYFCPAGRGTVLSVGASVQEFYYDANVSESIQIVNLCLQVFQK